MPMHAGGTALQPDAVDELEVNGGIISQKLLGLLVVTAEAVPAVEFKLNNYHKIISKPVIGRVVALRI
jgi:hypothetical protein